MSTSEEIWRDEDYRAAMLEGWELSDDGYLSVWTQAGYTGRPIEELTFQLEQRARDGDLLAERAIALRAMRRLTGKRDRGDDL